jgi:hypothetical protein
MISIDEIGCPPPFDLVFSNLLVAVVVTVWLGWWKDGCGGCSGGSIANVMKKSIEDG